MIEITKYNISTLMKKDMLINQTITLCPVSEFKQEHQDTISNINKDKYFYKKDNKDYEMSLKTLFDNYRVYIIKNKENTSISLAHKNLSWYYQAIQGYVTEKIEMKDYKLSRMLRLDIFFRKEYNELCNKYEIFFGDIWWDDERINIMSKKEIKLAKEYRQELLTLIVKYA